MAVDAERYGRQLVALLPPGKALPGSSDSEFRALLEAMGAGLAKIEQRARDLLDEADPRSTVELIAEWERALGLPDPCTGSAETLQERRLRLLQKIDRPPLQNVAFYQALAEELGYTVTIQEFVPMEHEFYWTVEVTEPRTTFFRCGSSRCQERLRTIARAEDLECLIERLRPAHTEAVVTYTGV